MNSSGFYNDGSLSILYADNVNFSGTYVAEVLQDGQLLIGSSSYPNIRTGFLTTDRWMTVTNGSGSVKTSFKHPPVLISRKYAVTTDISKVFTSVEAENTKWNEQPQVLTINFSPKESDSSFLITGNVMASRREGAFCTFLRMNNENIPIAFSTAFTMGFPVSCQISVEMKPKTNQPFTLSLCAAPLVSGTLVINGAANGGNFLGIPNSLQSSLSIMEIFGG